ncbi:MAG: uroporphyrinogen-III C-methyltransferase [Spongiibacteraceae bacterium]|jgi:uroporphyrin-3 C-methyltransferase|nr:uroporphyrinogen-III C-methyltransferase [Spongiibacteraceae bacterium]
MEEKKLPATPAEPAATSPSSEPPRQPAGARPVRSSGAGWLAALALLLALGALGAVGWLVQREADQQQMLEFRLQATVQNQVTALERLRERFADERAAARSDRRELRQQLETLSGQLQRQAQRLNELSQSDRTDWRLAELDYLLKLARQKLLLGDNPLLAAELLESVDATARDLDDPELLPLRTALAEDIARLRGLPTIDVEGLYFSLEALAGRVAELQLVVAAVPANDESGATASEGDWRTQLRSGLAEAWDKLASLVQIRRRDEPYEPLLAPQFEAALRQQLLLLVEQAQLALMAGNQRLYTDSLRQAAQWTERYFSVDQAVTQAVVAQLEALAEQAVSVDAPDISGSQRALRDYLRGVAQRRGEPAPASAPPAADPATSAAPSAQGVDA